MITEWILYKNHNTGFSDVVSKKDYKEIKHCASLRGEDLLKFEIIKSKHGGKKTMSELNLLLLKSE